MCVLNYYYNFFFFYGTYCKRKKFGSVGFPKQITSQIPKNNIVINHIYMILCVLISFFAIFAIVFYEKCASVALQLVSYASQKSILLEVRPNGPNFFLLFLDLNVRPAVATSAVVVVAISGRPVVATRPNFRELFRCAVCGHAFPTRLED